MAVYAWTTLDVCAQSFAESALLLNEFCYNKTSLENQMGNKLNGFIIWIRTLSRKKSKWKTTEGDI